MTASVGTKFSIGNTEYEVTRVEPVQTNHDRVTKILERTGKDSCRYFAAKVLKNGTLSKKVEGIFLRFKSDNRFISAL